MIGYRLLQSMQNRLPGRQVAAIINQRLVEAADPAFADPRGCPSSATSTGSCGVWKPSSTKT